MRNFKQQQQKKRYQKPEITDQGSIVTITRGKFEGGCWDGAPNTIYDERSCGGDSDIQ